MSSGVSVRQQSSSRKRPVDGGGGDNDNDNNCSSAAVPGLRSAFSSNNHRAANQAQEYKRRQILQESWGLREVLAECGLLDFAPPTPAAATASSNSDDDNGGKFKYILTFFCHCHWKRLCGYSHLFNFPGHYIHK